MLEFVKKYWGLLLGALGFVVGLVWKSQRSSVPPMVEKPPKKSHKVEVTPDAVGEYQDEKDKSDEKIDNMDRSDLIDDINSRYK